LKLLIVFADAIYARGLQVTLAALADVDEIHYAAGVVEARVHAELSSVDIVLLDYELPGAAQFAQELGGAPRARVLLCTRRSWTDDLAGAIGSAAGVLSTDMLTPEVIPVAVRAISAGVEVIRMSVSRESLGERSASASGNGNGAQRREHLTRREHAVLSLVAEGIPSREIAQRLAYSERTVKNILHDVLTKLDARSRSHAVAMAVREGII
jgi:DNA-binding NarL/FixJ family response regulator